MEIPYWLASSADVQWSYFSKIIGSVIEPNVIITSLKQPASFIKCFYVCLFVFVLLCFALFFKSVLNLCDELTQPAPKPHTAVYSLPCKGMGNRIGRTKLVTWDSLIGKTNCPFKCIKTRIHSLLPIIRKMFPLPSFFPSPFPFPSLPLTSLTVITC